MKDFLEIGPTPAEEPCQQVGTPGYDREVAHDECRRFIDAIRLAIGPEPPGARLYVRRNEHDFGTYLEVACEYTDHDSAQYAFAAESDRVPATWPESMTLWTSLPPAYDGFGTIRPQDGQERVVFNTTYVRAIVDPVHKEWQLGRYLSGGSACAAGSVEEARLFGRVEAR